MTIEEIKLKYNDKISSQEIIRDDESMNQHDRIVAGRVIESILCFLIDLEKFNFTIIKIKHHELQKSR